eukprot:1091500-Prymnesium_polylepis.4
MTPKAAVWAVWGVARVCASDWRATPPDQNVGHFTFALRGTHVRARWVPRLSSLDGYIPANKWSKSGPPILRSAPTLGPQPRTGASACVAERRR